MDTRLVSRIISKLSGFGKVEQVEFLDKGFSHEQKYALWENDTPRYLMRLCGIEHHNECERVFHLMELHYSRGVRCSKPLHIGKDEDESVCFAVYSYISGDCAEEALPSMPKEVQYEIGIQAAEELRKMHQMPCPDCDFNWYEHRKAKFYRQWGLAEQMGLSLPGQEMLLSFIESNIDFMRDVPSRFQHDDYHPANIIVRNGAFAGVIDFNRCDWGDPIHDFYKLPQLTCYMSMPFAVGQITGYFSNNIPNRFWRLYNLYVAMNVAGSLTWSMNHSPEEFRLFRSRAEDTLATHDFTSGGPPVWFTDAC